MDCGRWILHKKKEKKKEIYACCLGRSVPKLLSKLLVLIFKLRYLLLRENLSVEADLAIDSSLTLPLQERCSVLCVGCQNTWCVVTPCLLLWEFYYSHGTLFLREKGLFIGPWGILDSRNSWLLYGCCSWSKRWVQGCCFSISSSLKALLFSALWWTT